MPTLSPRDSFPLQNISVLIWKAQVMIWDLLTPVLPWRIHPPTHAQSQKRLLSTGILHLKSHGTGKASLSLKLLIFPLPNWKGKNSDSGLMSRNMERVAEEKFCAIFCPLFQIVLQHFICTNSILALFYHIFKSFIPLVRQQDRALIGIFGWNLKTVQSAHSGIKLGLSSGVGSFPSSLSNTILTLSEMPSVT